jgi:tRNA (guanosine-2'-O-)-methyltransferase
MDPRFAALLPFLSDERVSRFNHVLESRTRHICLVLENVYQSRNASAVMRTCDGVGIQDVHLIENINPWVFNRHVSKGTPSWLTLHRYREASNPTEACIEQLQSKGYAIAVTSPHADGQEVHELPIDKPIALVMGTEFEGVSNTFLAAANHHVYIPMTGFAESLNISVAAGIIMHDLARRSRTLPDTSWALSKAEKDILRAEWAMKTVRKSDVILKQLKICLHTGKSLP